MSLTWEQCPTPAAWESPNCAKNSYEGLRGSRARRDRSRRGAGIPTRTGTVCKNTMQHNHAVFFFSFGDCGKWKLGRSPNQKRVWHSPIENYCSWKVCIGFLKDELITSGLEHEILFSTISVFFLSRGQYFWNMVQKMSRDVGRVSTSGQQAFLNITYH